MKLPNLSQVSLPSPDYACEQKADYLNRCCRCSAIDKEALQTQLQQDHPELYSMLFEDRPHLFADTAVFVSVSTLQKQQRLINAIEQVIALPSYQQTVLAYAPSSAMFTPKAHGVFLGYDFHLTSTGSQLIEINTNAGGALLNILLKRVQKNLCADNNHPDPETAVMAMFHTEWQAERGSQALHTIAIVDENPETQYLHPEFILFQKLFQRHHINAVICDATELSYHDGAVWYQNLPIDLVYNRLTDFALDHPRQQVLRAAYLANAVVVTPHPRAHALYADKRNLAVLTNQPLLQELGVPDEIINTLLEGIAHTVRVQADDAENLWAKRKQLFFKPTKGYGSKAVYRGDKLTKRVFEEILSSDYVAQVLVPPSERQIHLENQNTYLKFDLRQYAYQDQILLTSSRLYQGQTTNFRTVGGGFAQVVAISNVNHHELELIPCDNSSSHESLVVD